MSSKLVTICASRRPPAAAQRDRGPHALVELRAERVDERLVLLGHLDVALGDEHLAVPGLHPQEPHPASDYDKANKSRARLGAQTVRRAHAPRGHGRASGSRAAGRPSHASRRGRPPERAIRAGEPQSRRASPKTSTGPAPAPRSRRPSATALAATARACRAAASGSSPSASRAASVEECVQPEPCAAPSGWRSPGSSVSVVPSKNRSVAASRCPPVTTTYAGPSACSARDELDPVERVVAGERARLGEVGRDHGRARQDLLAQRRARRRAPAAARRTRRPSPGRARSACRARARRAPPATVSIVSASPSIPIFTASTPRSSATARTCPAMISGATGCTALTADGVLDRDRRDRRRPVHARARERLEVGLDPRAAAGVRPGDRQDDGHAAARARRREDTRTPRVRRGRARARPRCAADRRRYARRT